MIAKLGALLSLASWNVAAHALAYAAAAAPLVASLVPWIAGAAAGEGLRRDALAAVAAGPDVLVAGRELGRFAPVDARLADALRTEPGVLRVERRLVAAVPAGGAVVLLVGVEAERLARVGPLAAGRAPSRPGEAVVGADLAREAGLAPGSRLSLDGALTRVFEVSGVLGTADAVAGSRAFVVSLADAADLFQDDRCGELCVWTRPGYEASVARAAERAAPRVATTLRAETVLGIERAALRRTGALSLFLAPLFLLSAACFAVLSWFVQARRGGEVAAYKLAGFTAGDVVLVALFENAVVAAFVGASACLLAWAWVRLGSGILLASFLVPDLALGSTQELPAAFTPLPLALGFALAFSAIVAGSVFASWRLAVHRTAQAFA